MDDDKLTSQMAMEKVHRRATKLVPHLKHLSHKQRLITPRFQSLLFRRRRGDMKQVYKIMNGIDRLKSRLEHSSTEHSMNEPEIIVRGYSWGADVVDPK